MHSAVELRIDGRRGCGWRKPGGLYLVSGGLSAPCGRLPIPLSVCPTCGHGIHPARGWTWIDSAPLLVGVECRAEPARCLVCPLSRPMGRVGLLWVGEQYYATPGEFAAEADRIGVSRRIPAVPTGFRLGETWVWLAHRRVISQRCPWCRDPDEARETEAMNSGDWHPAARSMRCEHCRGNGVIWHPGVFSAFRPVAVEYVTKGTESDAVIEALVRRGITPVRVVRDESVQRDLLEPDA